MRLNEITIKNFKAIKEASFHLSDFNVIVGTNGSGKSSILQALHWMFQSGRNRSIDPRKSEGATLSERDATYMPSPDYRNAGHGNEYGNKQGTPQLDLSLRATHEGNEITASMWIKSARNEGLSVHVPSGNSFVSLLRDPIREFSAYIPGLAGIPLSEEKRTKLIVQRLAAAGDANTVLRNILLLLNDTKVGDENGLSVLVRFVSRVMGDTRIEVEFDESQRTTIEARFQTEEMRKEDAKRFKPLELAGIGFLQVIQIFAYLVYFRPVVVLVDEPDSHLHPSAQERLVSVLADAARELDAQVILSTHSPSVVRALPAGATVIWMKDGQPQEKGNTAGRGLMGWGLLDRKLLLMTEDKEVAMLQSLLKQWPDIDRKVAVWPFHGSSKLPTPEVAKGLIELTGGSLKIILHRDRDFLMPAEVDELSRPYKDHGQILWFTKYSDFEAYWINDSIISAHFEISPEDAMGIIKEAVELEKFKNKNLTTIRKKRIDAMNRIGGVGKGNLPQFGDQQVIDEYSRDGDQYCILGKDMKSAIRECAQKRKLPKYQSFAESVPPSADGMMAEDLRETLSKFL